jgi:prepilin-type N-terminal cleavage/methylation domain-containing protein
MLKTKKLSHAFTLVEIMFTMLIIGILIAIAVPNFRRTQASGRQKSCVKNLATILSAKEQWAMDFRKASTDIPVWPTDLVGPNLYIKDAAPSCPTDGSLYIPGSINTMPQCGNTNAIIGPDVTGVPHLIEQF